MEKKILGSHGFLLLYNIIFLWYCLKVTFLVMQEALAQGMAMWVCWLVGPLQIEKSQQLFAGLP